MIPNIIFMSYSVGQDSRHEGKATVLRDFNNVRAPNKQQKKKCDPLMSVCGFLWCLQQQEEAQTGPGSRCFYQPSFRKATLSRSTSASPSCQKCPEKAEQPLSRQKESRQTDSVLPELHLLTHLPGLCISGSILPREDNQRHTC